MRFYGECGFFDAIPLDKAKPEYGNFDVVEDHGVLYAMYFTPYEDGCRRHHGAPDYGFNMTPGRIVDPWGKGEKPNVQKE